MTEPIVVTDAALVELEASRAFEAFYQAEARTLFRRLWLVTGNRAEAEGAGAGRGPRRVTHAIDNGRQRRRLQGSALRCSE